MTNPGKIHVYTGSGKGKTTAALGLALRAAGAGWPVFIGHFVKSGPTSEHRALERIADRVTVDWFGKGRLMGREPTTEDRAAAAAGLTRCREALGSGNHRMVILDEILVAVAKGIVSEDALLDLIEVRPPVVELVLTGRGATERVTAAADLVTEMRERKHYFSGGFRARVGVEK